MIWRICSNAGGPAGVSHRSALALLLSGSTFGAQTWGVFFCGQEHNNSCLEQFLHFSTTDSADHTPPFRRNREECTGSPLNTAVAAPLQHPFDLPPTHRRMRYGAVGWNRTEGREWERVSGENRESQAEKGKIVRMIVVHEKMWGGLLEWQGVVLGLWSWEQPTQNVWYVCCAPTRHMTMLLGHLTEKQGSAACLPPEHMLRPLSEPAARGLRTCRAVKKHNRQCVTEVQNHGLISSYTFEWE